MRSIVTNHFEFLSQEGLKTLDSFSLPSPNLMLNDNKIMSLHFDDIYHSKDGALKEANAVFINGNNLIQRWENLSGNFCVAELGFGFGVSFIACAKEWAKIDRKHYLNFVSIEGYPLSKQEISDYYSHKNPSFNTNNDTTYLVNALIKQYPFQLKSYSRIHFPIYKICLTLIFNEVSAALSKLDFIADAWFLDGFSPAKNSEMWSEDTIKNVYKNTKAGGSFSTYSVSRLVKDNTQSAGFKIQVIDGFKSKKQMLTGFKPITLTIHKTPTPDINKIAIIGGGIAGVSIANALCQRGINVTIFEKSPALAKGASGNKSAVIMPLLSSKIDDLTEFYLAGYLHTNRVLEEFNSYNKLESLNLNGALRIASVKKWNSVVKNCEALGLNLIAETLSSAEIKDKYNISQENDALFFLKGGSIEPAELIYSICKRHETKLKIELNARVTQIDKIEHGYQITTHNNTQFIFDTIVFANAFGAANIKQTSSLPIEKIKGQLFSTLLQANLNFSELNFPICYDGYISPISNSNRVIIGATYEHNKHEEIFNPEVINDLSARLIKNTGISISLESNNIEGKVCFRTTSPDRLPMIGRLNDREGNEQKNLYVSLGHGSRGMISCFLAAEVITDLICETPPALPKHILSAISPLRFFLREKRRGVSTEDSYPASFIWRS